jgi:hypothetical protein
VSLFLTLCGRKQPVEGHRIVLEYKHVKKILCWNRSISDTDIGGTKPNVVEVGIFQLPRGVWSCVTPLSMSDF